MKLVVATAKNRDGDNGNQTTSPTRGFIIPKALPIGKCINGKIIPRFPPADAKKKKTASAYAPANTASISAKGITPARSKQTLPS